MMPFMNNHPQFEEEAPEQADGAHAHPSYEARLKALEDAVFGQQEEQNEGMNEATAQPQPAAPKKKLGSFYGG